MDHPRPEFGPEPRVRPGSRPLRELSPEECLDALRQESLGRIAISDAALPMILPVSYRLDGAAVVFRTRQGGLLDRCCRNTIVAFEVDHVHPDSKSGWSVVVVGVANVQYGGDWLRAMELGLSSIGAAEGTVFIRITPGTVTGRAVEPVPAAAVGVG